MTEHERVALAVEETEHLLIGKSSTIIQVWSEDLRTLLEVVQTYHVKNKGCAPLVLKRRSGA